MNDHRTCPWACILLMVSGMAGCAPVEPPATPKHSAEPSRPAEPITVFPTPEPIGPRARLKAAIDHVRERDLLTTNGFWTVFHGILGLGPSVMLTDPETGRRTNALDYIADSGELRGLRFLPTRDGLDVQMGPFQVGQGHQDQFIAEMAQWGLPADKRFRVLGKDSTFLEFVRQAQMRARTSADQELSWAVLVLGQYLGTDIAWTNANGERLRYEDLLRYELAADVERAACGGTHRLFGLTWAHQLHEAAGGKPEGVWHDIADHAAKYRDRARALQNADGSFSTAFFQRPGNSADPERRINTTGHTLEWLALTLSDTELRQPWVENGANALALMILDRREAPIEGGSLYHAVHGLLIYFARVYGADTLGPNRPFLPSDPDAPRLRRS